MCVWPLGLPSLFFAQVGAAWSSRVSSTWISYPSHILSSARAPCINEGEWWVRVGSYWLGGVRAMGVVRRLKDITDDESDGCTGFSIQGRFALILKFFCCNRLWWITEAFVWWPTYLPTYLPTNRHRGHSPLSSWIMANDCVSACASLCLCSHAGVYTVSLV